MKVHYVLKRYPRLSETFVVRELATLEALGAQVSVDSLMAPEDGPRHAEVQHVRAAVRYLPRRPGWAATALRVGLRRPRAVWREVRRARSRARAGDAVALRRLAHGLLVAERVLAEQPDVLHAHFATAAAEVAAVASRVTGVPVTVTAHAKDVFHTENADVLAGRLDGVAAVVTVSEYNLEHLGRTLPGTRIRLVRNGVPLGRPNVVHAGRRDAPVLCVCRLVPKKGVDVLVRAVALAAVDDPWVRLDVIGDGPLREELVDLARELGVADRVTFHGAMDSAGVEAAYARASLVALPCRVDGDGDRDGLPTVLVEALARGLPVVSTDVVGIPELVRDRATGRLVAPDDPPALARAVAELRADPVAARALGAAGRELVAADYAPDRSGRALLGVWTEVRR
ncbi:glycosyltransferase [Arthrobacter sp. NEB 688]|uniref:glycosyltransferase n=1 Tax=Arthrobacter sp. NEB 688 TaxID=904039 RepID=UPI0015673335|nr:glycosyltransferase [Arthrobacter sp. NEB 688]QKE84487.1 glycosyltransferase [Arthrobacter sp. NEB 688]